MPVRPATVMASPRRTRPALLGRLRDGVRRPRRRAHKAATFLYGSFSRLYGNGDSSAPRPSASTARASVRGVRTARVAVLGRLVRATPARKEVKFGRKSRYPARNVREFRNGIKAAGNVARRGNRGMVVLNGGIHFRFQHRGAEF